MSSILRDLLLSIESKFKEVEKENKILKNQNQILLSKIEKQDKIIESNKKTKIEVKAPPIKFSEDLITQERLKELLSYDPITGTFKRLKQVKYKINLDKIVGSNCNGYLIVNLDGKFYRLHRLVWLYMYGKFPENQIDHIDGDRCNNKLQNLREATNSENARNKSKYKKNKSGYKGVYWIEESEKWRASIILDNKKTKHIGLYENLEDAVEAHTLKALELHGEFVHKDVWENYQKILAKKIMKPNL